MAERLSAFDGSFLRVETANAHMHVAWSASFRVAPGRPRPSLARLRRHIEARLELVPRFRTRLAYPPPRHGRALLGRRSDFDVSRHVLELGMPNSELDDRRFAFLCDRCSPSRWRATVRCGRSGSPRGCRAGAAGSWRACTMRSSTASRRSRWHCSSSIPTRMPPRPPGTLAGRLRPRDRASRRPSARLGRRWVAQSGALRGARGGRAALGRPPARRHAPARSARGR